MTTMEKPKIVICGSIAIDQIMNFSGKYKDYIKPEMLHVLSISILLDNKAVNYGGVGANICYTLALLGESPILLGSVGPDTGHYLKRLESMGIDISHIHKSEKPTACFTVFTDSDDNQIGGFFPGAMADSDSLSFEEWKDKKVFAIISPHDPFAMAHQVEECKRNKMRLFYDIGQQVVNVPSEDLIAGIHAAELLILNDYEFATLCERSGRTPSEINKQIPVVVVTKGKDGSTISGKSVEKEVEVPAAMPSEVVDPTGAGDAFRAGFLYGYVRGLDLETCGKIGSVTSIYAIESHGTQEFTFTKAEFTRRYEENFKTKLSI